MAPSVLLPPLKNKRSEGLLCSDVAKFMRVHDSDNNTNHLVVDSWGEKALSSSSQCSLYFPVLFFHHHQLYCFTVKAAQETSAVAKMRKIQIEPKSFLLHPAWLPLSAAQCLPAPAALQGILPGAPLWLNSQTGSQVLYHVTLSIRAGAGGRGVRHSPQMWNLREYQNPQESTSILF